MFLYCTADDVGINTGGGSVTHHESESLKSLGPCEVLDRKRMPPLPMSVWGWDEVCVEDLAPHAAKFQLGHFYAGTFSKTVRMLKNAGCRVTHTAAAHDVALSRKAHTDLGLSFDYPHLNNPEYWRDYVLGYQLADVLIVPSNHSRGVMRKYECTNRIEVIPHGCDLPTETRPLPDHFTVGYLGAYGPDKGVRYLLEAWKLLGYKDAQLLLGGRDSESEWVRSLIRHFGAGNIKCVGWVDDVSDFYNACSLYVQPSVTEGFGLEVLEACAHARPVVASTGCGAEMALPDGWKYDPTDVKELAAKIDSVRRIATKVEPKFFQHFREIASRYTWNKVRAQYAGLWQSLLGGKS